MYDNVVYRSGAFIQRTSDIDRNKTFSMFVTPAYQIFTRATHFDLFLQLLAAIFAAAHSWSRALWPAGELCVFVLVLCTATVTPLRRSVRSFTGTAERPMGVFTPTGKPAQHPLYLKFTDFHAVKKRTGGATIFLLLLGILAWLP